MTQAKLYKHVLSHEEDFRVLCFNCNWLAHVEGEQFVVTETVTAG